MTKARERVPSMRLWTVRRTTDSLGGPVVIEFSSMTSSDAERWSSICDMELLAWSGKCHHRQIVGDQLLRIASMRNRQMRATRDAVRD